MNFAEIVWVGYIALGVLTAVGAFLAALLTEAEMGMESLPGFTFLLMGACASAAVCGFLWPLAWLSLGLLIATESRTS